MDCLSEAAKGVDDATLKAMRLLCIRSRTGAGERGKLFAITPQDVARLWKMQGGKCALSGRPMTLSGGMGAASIDRIDSRYGYTANNIWLVCWAVNLMKSSMTVEEFGDWCKAVVLHALDSAPA